MSNKVTIAVSGKSGCGNSSVSRLVARRLGLTLINYTFHTIAEEQGISFQELLRRASRDDSYDLELDRKQRALAAKGGCVLGSRLAIWLVPAADLTVYLTASLAERAKRIAKREGRVLAEVMEETRARDDNDHLRFKRLYKIDNDDYAFADLVIDTEQGDERYVADRIIACVRDRGTVK